MHAGPDPVFHRDIRQPNILKYIGSSHWFLIDWSDASKAPTLAAKHLSAASHSPAIRLDNHGAEVDIWGVAYYMSELVGDEHSVVRDKTLVRDMAMKWQRDPTFTAEMALTELEVGTLSPLVCCIYGLVCCREQGTFSRIWKASLPFPLRRDRPPPRRRPEEVERANVSP